MTTSRARRAGAGLVGLLVLALLTLVPFLDVAIPGLLTTPLNSPGSMHLVATCLVFAGLALSYDLLYGRTGLLSFGHALHIAMGSYLTNIAVTAWDWSLLAAVGMALLVSTLTAAVLGGLSLRAKGLISFAMITLAFAEAGSILVLHNPGGLTGGGEGLTLAGPGVPAALVGVVSKRNVYWLALGFLVLCVAVVRWCVVSSPGHVWAAIRENETRVEVLGISAYRYKLGCYTLASALGTLGGAVYLLLAGGSRHSLTTSHLTLSLLVMVILGGAGSRWGPVIGGITYVFFDNWLIRVAGSSAVEGLPEFLAIPLSQPTFTLGILFVLVVMFAPGGVSALVNRSRIPRKWGCRRSDPFDGDGVAPPPEETAKTAGTADAREPARPAFSGRMRDDKMSGRRSAAQ